jgi:hypothetical protein
MVSPASIRRVLLDRYGQFMNKAQVIREIGKTQLAEAIERNQLRHHHTRRAFSGSRNTRVFFLTLDVAAYLTEIRSGNEKPVKRRKKLPPLEVLAWAASITLLLTSLYDSLA